MEEPERADLDEGGLTDESRVFAAQLGRLDREVAIEDLEAW